MNYTLHQLRIFLEVCDKQSVTKASETLFLTQPAVTLQLKKFQSEFNIPLTEVIGRQLYVTDFGRKIEILARQILDTVDEMSLVTDQYKGILAGDIHIASASTGKYVIPYFLSGFMRKYPLVNISIDVTNKTNVVADLQANTIDFAMISVLPQNLALDTLSLLPNELHLVAAANYPGLPKRLKPKHLSAHTLIFREEGSATRQAMYAYLKANDVRIGRSIQMTSNEAVKQAVRAGLGLSIMPRIGIRSELKLETMQLLKIKGLPTFSQWNLAYSQGKQLSPAASKLIEYIDEYKERIIEAEFS
ncbi:MAG: LysR substrate-binding domain-containing protein [Bacteroidota bacterium]